MGSSRSLPPQPTPVAWPSEAGRGGRVAHAKTRRRKEDEILLCRAGDDVGEHAQFEVSRSLQFGVRVVITRGVVGFAVVV